MAQEEKHTKEEVEHVCAAIRREAGSWCWLFNFGMPVILVINGHRILRGKKPW